MVLKSMSTTTVVFWSTEESFVRGADKDRPLTVEYTIHRGDLLLLPAAIELDEVVGVDCEGSALLGVVLPKGACSAP